MISHFSIALCHFFLTLYQFVSVCTSFSSLRTVTYPLRPYFDPARSPIRLTDFGFGIGFPLAALSRRRQRVGFNAIAWDTFGMALGRPMGRSKSSMFAGLGTVVRLIWPLSQGKGTSSPRALRSPLSSPTLLTPGYGSTYGWKPHKRPVFIGSLPIYG